MTTAEILDDEMIAVLPLGATEHHGPHLAPDVDWIIADGVCARTKALLPKDFRVEFLAVEKIGYSIEHADFAVTRTLAFDEAIQRWIAIGEACARRGIRKFVMLNAHGGNAPLMTIVATELRVRFSMLAIATSWTRFGFPDGLIDAEEKAFGIHGGLIETSVMLALRPDTVDMAKAKDFPSAQAGYAGRFRHLRAYGPHAFGWKMTDLNGDNAAGDATQATAELGERLLDHAARGFAELLNDARSFDPATLR
ncbi:MAG: creatininase family protein [Phyllobacteriaceae bacterium]|nr:creatininase family protein [Phyllobacteriaceae bacterium]